MECFGLLILATQIFFTFQILDMFEVLKKKVTFSSQTPIPSDLTNTLEKIVKFTKSQFPDVDFEILNEIISDVFK